MGAGVGVGVGVGVEFDGEKQGVGDEGKTWA